MSIFKRLPLRSLLAVSVTGLLSVFLAQGGTALAAPATSATTSAQNPTVVVVRDITPSNCTLTLTSRNLVGQAHQTRTVIPCSAGTFMAVLHVPQSQAIARHEAYVAMPLASASQSQVMQTGKQIEALINTTNARLHPTQSKPSPYTSCSLRSQSLYGSWVWGGDSWSSGVSWDTHSDCSIYIYYSYVSGSSSSFSIYWGQDKYAGWSQGRGCRYLGTNYLSANPNTTQSAGYGYEQWLYNGSNCTVFDDARYTYLSPLKD